MSAPEPVLVTGATGNVGREVVAQLAHRGGPVVAAVRDPAAARRALEPLGAHVSFVRFDLTDTATHASALADVSRVFLLRPGPVANVRRDVAPFIGALAAAGVRQVTFISVLGAERNPLLPHRRIERALAQANVPSTSLRASYFMQSLSTVHRPEIRERRELFVPAGDGRTSMIDVRDVAAVAVRTLTEDGHAGRAYDLTGAEAPTYHDVVDALTDVLGVAVRYPRPGVRRYVARRRAEGWPPSFIAVTTALYTAARLGRAGRITPDAERLLGRAPITLRGFVEDYRDVWV